MAAAAMAAMAPMLPMRVDPPKAVMPTPTRKRRPANYHKRRTGFLYGTAKWSGDSERDRRKRQIARGQLKAENGLVLS